MLCISSFWSSGPPVVLVDGLKGRGMCAQGGWEEVPLGQALSLLDGAQRSPPDGFRRFAAEIRLTSSPLREVSDQKLLALVRKAIRLGRLLAVRQTQATTVVSRTTALRRLVAQIEKQARGKLLFRGRQYKLVVDVDLAKLPDREDYETVGQTEARIVLAGMAKENRAPAELLGQTSENITKDWRAPFSQPDGLVLLRRIPTRAAAAKDLDPAITPSALRKLRDEGWLEIVLVDAGMEPVADKDYDVRLADGGTKSGKTSEKGFARLEGLTPGECMVRFPTVEGPVVLSGEA
jgi:hypothetical protein